MALYQYGDRIIDGKSIDISQIPRSLRRSAEWACNCPVCAEPFVAAIGEYNEPHFRHKNKHMDPVCDVNHVNQTGLHKRAKDVIQAAKRFHLPAYTVNRSEIDFGNLPKHVIMSLPEQFTYSRARWIYCDRVELEKRISTIIPDVVAYTPEGEFLIEICVTNPVGPSKILKAEELRLPLLEVDLSDLKGEIISEQELRESVIDGCERTEWLVFPEKKAAYEAAKKFYLEHDNIKAYRKRQEELRQQQEAEEERRKKALEAFMDEIDQDENLPPEEICFTDLSNLSQSEFEKITNAIYAEGYSDVKDQDFSKDVQIRDRYDRRWLRCWACGEILQDGEMVMYQWARGLCRTCHYDKGVSPAWK